MLPDYNIASQWKYISSLGWNVVGNRGTYIRG